MSEPEIDALMTGQEDENGSVHYEGELTFSHNLPPSFILFKNSKYFFCPSSFRQAHHVCVRVQQRER